MHTFQRLTNGLILFFLLINFSGQSQVTNVEGETVALGYPAPHLYGVIGFNNNRNQSVFITCGSEGAKMWETSSGELIRTFRGSAEGVSKAFFSPDNKSLITTGIEENKIRLWDVNSGRLTGIIPIPNHLILSSVDFSPDSKYCITYSKSKENEGFQEVNIIELKTFKVVKLIKLAKLVLFSVAVSPDGKYLALESTVPKKSSTTLELYNLPSGSLYKRINQSANPKSYSLTSLVFSTSGQEIIKIFAGDSIITQTVQLLSGKALAQMSIAGSSAWVSTNGTLLFVRQGEKIIIKRYPGNELIGEIPFSTDGYDEDILGLDDVESRFALHVGKELHVYEITDHGKVKLLHVMSIELPEEYEAFTGSKGAVFTNQNQILVGSESSVFRIGDEIYREESDSLRFYQKTHYQRQFNSAPTDGHEHAYATFADDDTGMSRAIEIPSAKSDTKVYKVNLGQNSEGFSTADINDAESMIVTSTHETLLNFQLWDTNGKLLLTWKQISPTDWIAIHPSGLFDMSANAANSLYFINGINIVAFSVYKNKYYEPGLLQKMLNGERVRALR